MRLFLVTFCTMLSLTLLFKSEPAWAQQPAQTRSMAGQTKPVEPPTTLATSPATQPTTKPTRPRLPRGFILRTLTLPNGAERKYVVFVPPQYALQKKAKFPVVVFLHGSGECGDDGIKHTTVGLPTLLAANPTQYPFIAVMPQATPTWFRGDNALAVWIALDEVMKQYRADPERIYLTGLSMGGFGTWELAAYRPDIFAAIVPICGVAPLNYLSNLVQMPIWVFHGSQDQNVPVKGSRDAVAELKRLGAPPKYTEYPGVAHNSWDRAYTEPELWKWLLEQRRPAPPRKIDYRWPSGPCRVWWLMAEAAPELKQPAHVSVEIAKNGRVTVQTDGVIGWTIGSDACPLKKGAKVEVTWNGNEVFAGEFEGVLGMKARAGE